MFFGLNYFDFCLFILIYFDLILLIDFFSIYQSINQFISLFIYFSIYLFANLCFDYCQKLCKLYKLLKA